MSVPTPLPNTEFYVLLALVRGEAHAYTISAVAHNDSLSRLPMPPGKIYPVLNKLRARGLVEEAGTRPTGPSGQARMHYRITKAGTFRLKEEFERLEHAMGIAKHAHLLNNPIPIEIQKWLERVR